MVTTIHVFIAIFGLNFGHSVWANAPSVFSRNDLRAKPGYLSTLALDQKPVCTHEYAYVGAQRVDGHIVVSFVSDAEDNRCTRLSLHLTSPVTNPVELIGKTFRMFDESRNKMREKGESVLHGKIRFGRDTNYSRPACLVYTAEVTVREGFQVEFHGSCRIVVVEEMAVKIQTIQFQGHSQPQVFIF